MLVRNHKVLPSLPRFPGKLIAFSHLLPTQTPSVVCRQAHIHTLYRCPPPNPLDDKHFLIYSSKIVFPQTSKFSEPNSHCSWKADYREITAQTLTHAVIWMDVSWRAEWLADWAIRKQLTQKSFSLCLFLSSLCQTRHVCLRLLLMFICSK